MIRKLLIKRKIFTAFLVVFLSFAFATHAAENDSVKKTGTVIPEGQVTPKVDTKGFNAGEMIIEHIVDSHEWHILTWNGKPVSIPLPVI